MPDIGSDPVLGILTVLAFLAAGLVIAGWLVAQTAQTMADWATDTKQAHKAAGGFPVLHPHATTAPLRFAVLHHTGVAEPHFDLLFEPTPGAPLVTWRSPVWPITQPTPLDRQPDHRPLYLDFEGPIPPATESGPPRGEVKRVAAGTFWFNDSSDGHWEIAFPDGTALTFQRHGETAVWIAEPSTSTRI